MITNKKKRVMFKPLKKKGANYSNVNNAINRLENAFNTLKDDHYSQVIKRG